MKPRPVAVVGAGPAGSALAALLAKAGRDVVLLEKDAFPRDKLCGEFLSGESQQLLKRIGCLDVVLALGPARIGRARFFLPSGREQALPLPQEALGVSRRALDSLLFDHAARCGAQTIEGASVTSLEPEAGGARIEFARGGRREALLAELAVAAWGRRSSLDRDLGRSFIRRDHPFLGMKRHLRPRNAALARELSGTVEVHLFNGGYCGLSFVEGGLVNACFLLKTGFLRAGSRWEAVVAAAGRESKSLASRLEALEPAEAAVQAVAQVPFCSKERRLGPVLFLGDAAGMIAPLCGDGQAMALESAVLLAELAGELAGQRLYTAWDAAWTRRFAGRLRLGRTLQGLLLNPAGRGLTLLAARLLPGLGSFLVRATRGGPRAHS